MSGLGSPAVSAVFVRMLLWTACTSNPSSGQGLTTHRRMCSAAMVLGPRGLAVVAITALLALGVQALGPAGTIVPLYTDPPDATWDNIITAKQARGGGGGLLFRWSLNARPRLTVPVHRIPVDFVGLRERHRASNHKSELRAGRWTQRCLRDRHHTATKRRHRGDPVNRLHTPVARPHPPTPCTVHATRLQVLGYVATTYGAKAPVKVEAEMAAYLKYGSGLISLSIPGDRHSRHIPSPAHAHLTHPRV